MTADAHRLGRRAVLAGLGAAPAMLAGPTLGANGGLVLETRLGREPLRLRSEARFAGAISSMRFRGFEYVNAFDHGRLFQGAVQFEGLGECLNPTLGGSSTDRRRGSSRLLSQAIGSERWETTTQMAWWNRVGEDVCTTPGGVRRRPAGRGRLSDVLFTQRHCFDAPLAPGVVETEIVLTLGSPRSDVIVEALTLYAPPAFTAFHLWRDGRLIADDDLGRPGERPDPVVLSTADGAHAFALLSRQGVSGHGRWRFADTSKVNLVYRPSGGLEAGHHSFRCAWAIGTRAEVAAALSALTAR